MGNSNGKVNNKVNRAMTMACIDDLMCQNIDSKRSIPGQDPVLVCPDAKCVSGNCICGNNCVKDSYTGICCSEIEEKIINGNEKITFCIESERSKLPSEQQRQQKNTNKQNQRNVVIPEGIQEPFSSTFQTL